MENTHTVECHVCDRLYTLYMDNYHIDVPTTGCMTDGHIFEELFNAYTKLCAANKRVCYLSDFFPMATRLETPRTEIKGTWIFVSPCVAGVYYTSAEVESMG